MNLISSTIGRFIPKYRTLGEWVGVYTPMLVERQISPKTLQNRLSHVKRIVASLGDRRLGSIKPHEISALIATIGKEHPGTAKRVLIELRSMFYEAVANDWVSANPAKAVRIPRVTVQRRRLSLDEWKLIDTYARLNAPPWVSRMVRLALVTGQRRSDLVKMRFDDVWAHDDGVEYLHIAQAKTGARVAIPLDLRLESAGLSVRDVIEDCRGYAKLGDGHLLRKSTGAPPCPESMSWRFEDCREKALPNEVSGSTPPSLHECRSLAAREYKGIVNTQDLLGHTKASMTDLYHNDRGMGARAGAWKTVSSQQTYRL